eukprot:gene7491-7700_t
MYFFAACTSGADIEVFELLHLQCTGTTESASTSSTDERLKTTLADLDALLGIQEESQQDDRKSSTGAMTADAANMELLQSAVTAEVQKLASKTDGKPTTEIERDMTDQMRKIVERAKQMTEDTSEDRLGQKAALQQEFEQLLNIFFTGENSMDKADIKKLKESGVFGPLTFWVTEIKNLEEAGSTAAVGQQLIMASSSACQVTGSSACQSGVLIRGNLRTDRLVVFQALCDKVKELFGSKYEKLWVTGTSGSAEKGMMPGETLEYFANPDNLNTDVLPPGLASWDPAPYLASAIPIAASIIGVNFMHEVGHRIAAFIRKVKLGPTYFVPNLQIGSFGGITPLQSLVKNRSDLWDVAAAGPVAGVAASAALLFIGLSQSHPGGLPQELLVPVPTQLFQGSLLLGSITRLALGSDVMSRTDVLISPLVIAGWCGLITNSLNLLPVGSLDGGRMVQAAFGMQALSLSAFFTYVGLGLGLLGSSLSLPFGLYVLICQRSAEKYIQDSVSPVASPKQTATAVAVLTAVLVLVPMAPEVAQSVGVGAPNPNLFM